MRFEFFVSRRYLASRERRGLISLITIISIGGVAVGVAALITVIAVMDGFDEELMSRIMSSSSHITISGWGGASIAGYESLLAQVEADPDVKAASPLIVQQAYLIGNREIESAQTGARIQGFDLERERRVTSFIDDIYAGKAEPGDREIVLGLVLASRLGVRLGDTITAFTKMKQYAHGRAVKRPTLRVCGVFKTGLYEVDANIAYTSLKTAQEIFLLDDPPVADEIHLLVRDPYRLGPVKRRLGDRLAQWRTERRKQQNGAETDVPPPLSVRGWDELNPEFFSALKLEKIAMFIILLLIVIVAAFNIIGTLVMIVIEKTREIGILRAMGTSQRQIRRIFLLQGLIVGVLGILFGLAIGFFLCWSLRTWFPINLPAGVYGISRLPVLIRGQTVAIIVGAALGICLLASLIPAWRASRLEPTEALRYE